MKSKHANQHTMKKSTRKELLYEGMDAGLRPDAISWP